MKNCNMSKMKMQENQMDMKPIYDNMGMQQMWNMNPMCKQMPNFMMNGMYPMNNMIPMQPMMGMGQIPMKGMMNPVQGICFMMIPCNLIGMQPTPYEPNGYGFSMYPINEMEMDEEYIDIE